MAPENEPEAIRQQMDETRNALTEKIATLEAQVVDTVQGASANVRETVETIKDAVQDSVQSVRESVGETVQNVRETFSLEKQMDHRPWTVLGVSAGIGFAVGYLLTPSPRRTTSWASYLGEANVPSAMPRSMRAHEGYETPVASSAHEASTPAHRGNGRTPEASRESAPAMSVPPAPQGPGLFENLANTFEGEISSLKGMAVGALGGLVRDFVTTQVPETLKDKVHELIDNMTTKLGGEPVKGSIFGEQKHEEQEGGARPEPFSSRMGSHN